MNKITHINAATIQEAVAAMGPTSNVCAGGTDLFGTLKSMCLPKPAAGKTGQNTEPNKIINIKAIPNMNYIKDDGGVLKIGTLATLTDIAESTVVQGKWSSLAEAAHRVASPQIRNMGTIGGNLCQRTRCWYFRSEHNAFPCFRKGGDTCFGIAGDNRFLSIIGGQICFAPIPSDTAIALAALDATIVTTQRKIAIQDFFIVLGTTLKDNEIVTEIQVPSPKAGTKQYFLKFAFRRSIDFAVASAAVTVTSTGGTVSDARIVMGGVAPIPYRATTAEALLKGKAVTKENADAAGAEAVKAATPQSNTSKNKYKIQIAKTLVSRALMAAV